MSDEPTIKDVLDALKATETRLEAKIDGVEAKIDGVEGRLTQQIRDTEKRLSNEIAGAYSLHGERFTDLEKRVSAIEQRLAH
jgi:hypothetical protein